MVDTDESMRVSLRSVEELPTVEIRHLDTDPLVRFAVADNHEIVTLAVNEPSPRLNVPDEVAIRTDARGLVAAHRLLFDLLWPEGVPLDRFEETADAEAPEGTLELLKGRTEVRKRLEDALVAAEEEILAESTNPRAARTLAKYPGAWEAAGAKAREEGVEVRTAMTTTPEMVAALEDLIRVPGFTLRHRDPERRPPIVIVDGRVAFQWIDIDPDVGPRADGDAVVWSTRPNHVRDLREQFVTRWEDAVEPPASEDAPSSAERVREDDG